MTGKRKGREREGNKSARDGRDGQGQPEVPPSVTVLSHKEDGGQNPDPLARPGLGKGGRGWWGRMK